ncbi:hypothetical protein VHEMI05696 [[Torrubiella] hemipterigena]|uniref:Protein transport protein sec16 n=1 Tax=[Torrubiella] hemipterigena TaxID=1531966 RepID=A0A0A1TH93_9HYPO|nr:hypothetical protein VHEMI05696 [[Torrubiella] hemipterigena]
MASEPVPNGSWHPALRPNTASHGHAAASLAEDAAPESTTTLKPSDDVSAAHDLDHEDGGAWFDDDEDAADAWLAGDEPVAPVAKSAEPSSTQPEPTAVSTEAQAVSEEPIETEEDGAAAWEESEAVPQESTVADEEQLAAWDLSAADEPAADEPIPAESLLASEQPTTSHTTPEQHAAQDAPQEDLAVDAQEPAVSISTMAAAHSKDPFAEWENSPADDEDPTSAWGLDEAAQPEPEAVVGEAKPEEPTPETFDDFKPQQPATAQHSSSMSFARTVSHEISFTEDDDDGDWSLNRTDTDPFKFMPPSDRTNSFPVVPLAESDQKLDAPLASNQAFNVLDESVNEVQQEHDAYADEANQEYDAQQAEPEEPLEPELSRPIGGQLEDTFGEQQATRYEEGLPLIPKQVQATEEAAMTPAPNGGVTDAFADQDDGGDDFFSQSQDKEPEFPTHFERKSTMQVMAAAEDDADDFFASQAAKLDDDAVVEDPEEPATDKAEPEDLATKWEAAFGGSDDDDDFLLEDQDNDGGAEVDPSGFLGSDDEGFLDDDDDDIDAGTPVRPVSQHSQAAPTNRYAPQLQSTGLISASASAPSVVSAFSNGTPSPFYGGAIPQPAAPAVPDPKNSTESFAGKSKAGYTSPYDLPTDLISSNIKPRKRPSLPAMDTTEQTTAPPRSVGGPMQNQNMPSMPPPGGNFQPPPAAPPKTLNSVRSDQSFFEDLPMASKPRSASRQSLRAQSPALQAPPQGVPPAAPMQNQQFQQPPASNGPEIPNLVAPARVNPYAALPSSSTSAPAPASAGNRYSPAPAHAPAKTSSAPPPAPSSRYSPAPNVPRQSNPQSPPSASSQFLPHLPRTSSPLAQFEISNEKGASNPEPRLHRMSSLPPTREVDEEDDQLGVSQFAQHARNSVSGTTPASPPKRVNSYYAPQGPGVPQLATLPPRSQTQSPGASRGARLTAPAHDSVRPATSHGTGPSVTKATSQSAYVSVGRPRGPSLSMNAAPPANGTEHDPLQRWQGIPIMSWGVGGTLVTSFPKTVPRYAMNQTGPSAYTTSSDVQIKNVKELIPLAERLSKFPGPLKGKSKKKEVLAWLNAGIDLLEKELPEVSMHHQLSLEAKRSIERLLLWKILHAFIEHDGHLEGTPAIEKSIRDLLNPSASADQDAPYKSDYSNTFSNEAAAKADSVDPASMSQIRDALLKGDREAAVWAAADKRLWGHALLIANTVSPDLYKRVTQEFVHKEVNAGQSNESLGALYQIMSGNHEDCVDELVPSHARAGLQLMSTASSSVASRDVMEGLDKWKETLTLVLSNRSQDDVRGLRSLGQLLATYGRAEAAHICFIFGRAVSVFGGLDEPNVDFVLIGSDHKIQSDHFGKETEALQLSEIYEYGLSLAGPSTGAPHLAAYKLQHAVTLAEYGLRDKAMQYCEGILTSMTAQTRRSPYHHPVLETMVDDFMQRLKQAPKEEGSSWISKPSMNKVSDSVWNRFNKFVAGDEADGGANGGSGDEHGPFARIASTPNLSRSPSVNNFEMYGGGGSPNYSSMPPAAQAFPAAPSAASSRYAPMAGGGAPLHGNPYEFASQQPPPAAQQPQAPAAGNNPYAPSSYQPSSYEPAPQENTSAGYTPVSTENNYGYQPEERSVTIHQEPSRTSPYQPASGTGYQPTPNTGYQEPSSTSPYQPAPAGGYQPYGLQESPQLTSAAENQNHGYQPSSYEPPQLNTEPQVSEPAGESEGQNSANGGYEAPSYQPYSYEPPTYQPDPPSDDEAPKPKKKSFMDDDDDDIPGLRSQAQEKTKAEIDKENAEMVRKIAEEEEKRAAEIAAAKKAGGWGFGGWFGGKKAESPEPGKKAIKAKLGEANSFVYDPELKRWINKAPGAENVEAPKATPPPPRAAPRSTAGTPPPGIPASASLQSTRSVSNPLDAPPLAPPGGGLPMARSASNMSAPGPPMAPPSRPGTSMSNASSIDDLLGAPGPRKAGAKKGRKAGRYVDVMAK